MRFEQPGPIERDAAIKRFEFTFETVWKAAKDVLGGIIIPFCPSAADHRHADLRQPPIIDMPILVRCFPVVFPAVHGRSRRPSMRRWRPISGCRPGDEAHFS
jgi:hypothetical protein